MTPPSSRRNDYLLLAALGLGHGFTDFCEGINGSMIPTLEAKYSLTLGSVVGIVAIMGFMGNLSQPLAGWFIDRSRTAAALLLTPALTGASLLVGFSQEPWQARGLYFLAGVAFGVFHPLAFLLARSTLVGRPALATAIFVSFGFIGTSTGSWTAGVWMERLGISDFHMFYVLSIAMAGIFFAKGVHKLDLDAYRTHAHEPSHGERGRALAFEAAGNGKQGERIPFGLLFAIGLLVAVQGGSLLFFMPKLFHTLYGSEGLGGRAAFLLGLTGGLCSYGYATLVDRGNAFRVGLAAQLLGILPLFGFFHFPDPGTKTLMVVMFAATGGAIFPPLASLAPRARGLSLGLRSSLMFGGVWGTTVVLDYGMARLVDSGLALETVLGMIRWAPFALIPLLIHASRRYAV